jgi:hypothetical protein
MGTSYFIVQDEQRLYFDVGKYYTLRQEYEEHGPLRASELFLRENPSFNDIHWIVEGRFRVVSEDVFFDGDYKKRGYRDGEEPDERIGYATFVSEPPSLSYLGMSNTNEMAWARAKGKSGVIVLQLAWDKKNVTAMLRPAVLEDSTR